ncbi:CTP synthase-like [Fagus crenata]
MVGKYTGLSDAYLSVLKALLHASVACQRKLIVDWVSAGDLEDITAQEAPDVYKAAWDLLKGADGVLVPGGFGDRGFARSVLGWHDANSTEFNSETTNPCVIFMPEGSKTHMGGTMHLGSRRTYFKVSDCKSAKLYGNVDFVDEQHRHRYEVNPNMISKLENAGLSFVGRDETGRRMKIVELPSHSYFVGVQFHPEFKSRPGKPSALFLGLIAAACGNLETALHDNGHVRKAVTSGKSNGHSMLKTHKNEIGGPIKSSNGSVNGVYSNGNGNGNGLLRMGRCFSLGDEGGG